MLCYLATGRVFVPAPILDLDSLLESLNCGAVDKCCLVTRSLKWYCAALSELSELHSGYIDFNTGLDYIVCRVRDICFCKLHIRSGLCF